MATQLPTKDTLIQSFQNDRQRFDDLVQRFGTDKLQQPITPENWTAKDYIAHMTHWKRGTMARVIAYLHSQPLPPTLSTGDEANETQRQIEADSTLEEVLNDWKEVHTHLQHLVAQQINDKNITEELSTTWDENEQLPICALLESICEHDTEHLDLIEQNLH